MTWCTQANVATTLTGPARALPGSSVSYTAVTTASGDYAAPNVQPVVKLSPGLTITNAAGGSYNATTGLLTLPTIPTLAVGASSTSVITFTMPGTPVNGKGSSTIGNDDADPSDNNGSLANANVTTTTNTAPTAQAKSATVSANTAVFTALPAMTGTDPENDPLTYNVTIPTGFTATTFGVVSYVNSSGTRVNLAAGTTTLTAAQATTLEFKRGSGTATTGTFQYTVSDPYGGVSPAVNYALTVGDQPAVYSSPNVFRRTTLASEDVLATVSDPDGTITSATITSGTLPTGMEFYTSAFNGKIQGTTYSFAAGTFTVSYNGNGGQPAAGTYNFTVTTSGAGTTTNVPVTIVIVGTDRASSYSTNPRYNRDALTSGMTLATATDPDGSITTATPTSGTAPTGMVINSSGLITVGASAPFAGTYTYNVSTTDAAGGTSSPSVTITVFDDTEAVYSMTAVPATGSYANGFVLGNVTDANGTNNATSTATPVSGTSALPPGVGLNPTTGQFTVTDRNLLRAGTYPVQVRTTDATGGITIQTVDIVIKNAPLPVTLTSFTAQPAGADAKLTWATAQELNNDHFVVERSFDGSTFAAVAQVQGQGTTASATNYTLTDAQVAGKAQNRPAYYRLRQVDTDGTSSFSSVQTVNFAASARTSGSVYPNPASNLTNTRLDLSAKAQGTYQVSIVDLTGRVLRSFSQAGGSNEALNVTSLPAGTYLVQVKGNGESFTQRLIKE